MLLFLLPLVFSLQSHDPFRPLQLCLAETGTLLAILLWMLPLTTQAILPLVRTGLGWPVFIFFLLSFLSCFGAPNQAVAWRGLGETLCWILFYYIFTQLGLGRKTRMTVLAAILAATCLTSLYSLVQLAGLDPVAWDNQFQGRMFGTFGNPDFLAGHLVLVAPLCLALFLAGEGRPVKIIFGGLGLLFLVCLAGTQTRGAWLGLGVSVLFMACLGWKYFQGQWLKNKAWFFGFGGTVIVLLLLFFSLAGTSRITALFNPSAEGNLNQRLFLWKGTLGIIRDHPWTGVGCDNFKIVYPLYEGKLAASMPGRSVPYHRSDHSHNDFLQMAAERGLACLGVFLWIIVIVFRQGLANIRQWQAQTKTPWFREDAVCLGLMAGLAGLLVHAFFNFPLRVVPTSMTFWCFIGVIMLSKPDLSGQVIEVPLVPAAADIKKPGKFKVPSSSIPNPAASVFNRTAAQMVIAGVMALLVYFIVQPFLFEKSWKVGLGEESLGDLNQAAQAYQAAAQFSPENWEAHFRLASVCRRLNQAGQASGEYEKALQDSPYEAEVWAEAGLFYCQQGNFKLGLADTAQAVLLAPHYGQGRFFAGNAHMLAGQLSQAEEQYNKAIQLDPGSAESHNALAVVYGRQGKYSLAVSEEQEAVRLRPGYEEALTNLGVSYFKTGKVRQARAIAQQVLQMDPRNPIARQILAR